MPINYSIHFRDHRGRPVTRGPRQPTGEVERLLDDAFGRGGRSGGGHGRGKRGPEVIDTSGEAIRAASQARANFRTFGGKYARRVYKPEGRRKR